MKKNGFWLAALLGGLFGGGLVWVLQGHSLSVLPQNVTYPDLIAVLLTAIGVFLAALGVFLAVLAFLGWATFKDMVKESVEAIVPTYLSHELQEGKSKQMLRDVVADFVKVYALKPEVYRQWQEQRAQTARTLDELDRPEE